MNISNGKRLELEQKLKMLDEYNRGLIEKPDFPEEVLREVREYQLEKDRELLTDLEKMDL